MNYPLHALFADDIAPDDEIDNLFSRLQQIEPPPTLVDTILASITHLSRQTQLPPSNLWESVKELVVHYEHKEPS